MTTAKLAGAPREVVVTEPKYDVVRSRTTKDGKPAKFFDRAGYTHVDELVDCRDMPIDKCLAFIEKAQAEYANSGFNEETGMFWAHDGEPHQQPEFIHRWWLIGRR